MFVQRIRRSVCVLGIVATLLAAPTATFGFDGEVNNAGDSDSVTDVFVSGGRATVDTEYVRDCPGGLSNYPGRCAVVSVSGGAKLAELSALPASNHVFRMR